VFRPLITTVGTKERKILAAEDNHSVIPPNRADCGVIVPAP
jgi:hypothetical protein